MSFDPMATLQDHLASIGFFMLIELGFFVADIILDCQMFWLYQDRQHYWFAAAQGFYHFANNHWFVSESRCLFLQASGWYLAFFQDEFTNGFCFVTCAKRETGEAVLSMFLQVYGLFYVTDHTSYWTASLSLILSAGGITYGCYIYFDLAVVFGETCAEIVPSQEAAIELEPAQVESPISSPPQAPPMMSVEPVSKGNKDNLRSIMLKSSKMKSRRSSLGTQSGTSSSGKSSRRSSNLSWC